MAKTVRRSCKEHRVAGAIEPRGVARPQQLAGSKAERFVRIKRLHQFFQIVGSKLDIVVQEQDVGRGHRRHPAIDGVGRTFVGGKLNAHGVARQRIRKNANGLRLVLDDDDLPLFGGQRLALDGFDAARSEIGPMQ